MTHLNVEIVGFTRWNAVTDLTKYHRSLLVSLEFPINPICSNFPIIKHTPTIVWISILTENGNIGTGIIFGTIINGINYQLSSMLLLDMTY